MIERKITIGSVDLARFWKDSLNGQISLCEKFPRLFDICT